MLKQKGFTVIQYALIALALIAALSGLVYAGKSFVDGLIEEGYARGRSEVRAEVAQRDNAQYAAVVEKLRVAQVGREMAERKAAAALEAQRAKFSQEKKDADLRTKKLVAAAAAGSLVLRDPGGSAVGPAGGGRGPEGTGGAAAGGADGAGAGGLSGEASVFLLTLTGEADERARRYNRLLGHYRVMESTCRGD
jgi:hypothetical protein